jgi:hypothetical protein
MDVGAQQVSASAFASALTSPLSRTAALPNEDDARGELQASPASDASGSKPPRRRNKPSLSCETCTVSGTSSFIAGTGMLKFEAGEEDKGKKVACQELSMFIILR